MPLHDDPPVPRSEPFQFSLRALMGWVLWFGICGTLVAIAPGDTFFIALFALAGSVLMLGHKILLHAWQERSGE